MEWNTCYITCQTRRKQFKNMKILVKRISEQFQGDYRNSVIANTLFQKHYKAFNNSG